MKKAFFSLIGCVLAGLSGLILFSCACCFVLSITRVISYPTISLWLFSCFMYAALGFLFFWLLRLGMKLFRYGRNTETAELVPLQRKEEEKPVSRERKADTRQVFTGEIDDVSYIGRMDHVHQDSWHAYQFQLSARPYGWEGMVDWADYAAENAFAHVDKVAAVFHIGGAESDLSGEYHHLASIKQIPQLKQEGAMLSLAGVDSVLHTLMKICWYNQTNRLTIYSVTDDEDAMTRYAETLIRRTFGKPEAMAKARQVPPKSPVTVSGNRIDLHSSAIRERFSEDRSEYCLEGAMKLHEKTPSVILCEDGKQVQEYVLGTKDTEDFSNQYFIYAVRVNMMGTPAAPAVQIDGFIAEREDITEIGSRIGYRFEGYHPQFNGKISEERRGQTEGRDLYQKGLRYPGYTIPGNVRLIGVCTHCGKSITFRGYSYHMMQADPLYSDDGLHVEPCYDPEFDKQNGTAEKDGRIYRYYNSFRCIHCGAPYIDYTKYPEMKKFGVLGCSYEL